MIIGKTSHDGRTLPVYSTESIAWKREEIVRTCRSTREATFLRGIRVDPWVDFNLNTLLKVADNVFEEVASYCGATVVGHTWGLAKTPLELRYFYYNDVVFAHRSLPLGMSLVAEVAVLNHAYDLDDADDTTLASTVRTAIASYRYDKSRNYVWTDGSTAQFMIEAAETSPKLVLTDIEPLVLRRESDDVGRLFRSTSRVE